MGRAVWAPGVNGPEQPSTARIRDYWLGGIHHSPVDRAVAQQVQLGVPQLPYIVRVHRAFLRRVVRHLVGAGVRQFLDLGSGVPTAGNVHEVASAHGPTSRVVYVDIDPVVVNESRMLLARGGGASRASAVVADLCQPDRVLAAIERGRLLDLDEPVAVLLTDVLHFVSDADDPAGMIGSYLDRLAPGSYLSMSHTGHDESMLAGFSMVERMYGTPVLPLTFRSLRQVEGFLTGLDIVEPGVVPVPLWRPEEEMDLNAERFAGYAALGRKP
ncbi:hypothetical protein GCM10012275_16930 [Longimycelium tulufanense]|uniref:S-adenosyl methyltransferase n=1 Tax=Longimycelium tulufanense TaxID=907463 RepID=A0A8J3FVP6_9PSEU|nr:SAM-dependent methyltransferase [Longimycelium tulufanense]GGM46499.1 hypothetical protein GCM10012275_16930 [Longimycelium tulufanense]